VFPGQTTFFPTGQSQCLGEGVAPFDYNCDGDEEEQFRDTSDEVRGLCPNLGVDNCNGQTTWISTRDCGANSAFDVCGDATSGLCVALPVGATGGSRRNVPVPCR